MNVCQGQKGSQGFTLVELLIATTLGLLVLLAVTNLFIGSRQSFRTQEGLSQVQENGRLLNYLMYPYIRLAGYLPSPIKQTEPGLIFTAATRALGGGNDNTDTADAIKDGTDSITVRYRGQDGATAGTADGSITNCGGVNGAAGVSASQMVTATFYIGTATGGVSNLMCAVTIDTTVSAPQPILEGVQDLQVLYGIGTTENTYKERITQRYYTANTVPDWTRVTSVRITVTVDSIEKVAGSTTADGADDGRLRRSYTSTLQIRNRLS